MGVMAGASHLIKADGAEGTAMRAGMSRGHGEGYELADTFSVRYPKLALFSLHPSSSIR